MLTQILDLFRRNLLKKLIALVAAFCMWIFVMTDQDPPIEGSYTVPLTISNAPYELIPIFADKTIIIEAKAPRSNFIQYDANAFRAYLNLEGLSEGDYQIAPRVVMPQGFELIETTPAAVDVKLDPMTERLMPVELLTTGNISQDAAITEIRKSMDTVTIVGPRSFVEKAKRVYGTVNLSGNTSSFELQIPMRTVDDKENVVPNVRVVPSVITVSVNIESGLKRKIVPIVPELNTLEGWDLKKVTVDPAQVELSGAESVVNPIVTVKTVPFTVQSGQRIFTGKLRLVIPEGVKADHEEVSVSAEVVRQPIVHDRNAN